MQKRLFISGGVLILVGLVIWRVATWLWFPAVPSVQGWKLLNGQTVTAGHYEVPSSGSQVKILGWLRQIKQEDNKVWLWLDLAQANSKQTIQILLGESQIPDLPLTLLSQKYPEFNPNSDAVTVSQPSLEELQAKLKRHRGQLIAIVLSLAETDPQKVPAAYQHLIPIAQQNATCNQTFYQQLVEGKTLPLNPDCPPRTTQVYAVE